MHRSLITSEQDVVSYIPMSSAYYFVALCILKYNLYTNFALLRGVQINKGVPPQQLLPKSSVRDRGHCWAPKAGPRKCTILPPQHLFSEKYPGIPAGELNSHFPSLIVWPKTPPLHPNCSVLHLILYMLKLHSILEVSGST